MTDKAIQQPQTEKPKGLKAIPVIGGIFAVIQLALLVLAAVAMFILVPAETVSTVPFFVQVGLPVLLSLISIGAHIYYMVGIRGPHKYIIAIYCSLMSAVLITNLFVRLSFFREFSIGIVLGVVFSGVLLYCMLRKDSNDWLVQHGANR